MQLDAATWGILAEPSQLALLLHFKFQPAFLAHLLPLLYPGLEDQLLGKLILKEKHELEEQRQQLLEEVQSYKKKIKQLEDDLLFR